MRRYDVLRWAQRSGQDHAGWRSPVLVTILDLQQPEQAVAVLDLQLRRMTAPDRDRMRAEYDKLREVVDNQP